MKGRYAVAVKDIQAGTALVAEEPVCASLNAKEQGTHCTHCMRLARAGFPCVWCSQVTFCSIRCRNLALSSYHR